jgi:hypothetical protein
MARGRIINNKISDNIDFNCKLSSDTARMFFMMLISHLDAEGRIQGEPGYLRSKVLPWREDITAGQIFLFLCEFSDFGFIKWYEIESKKYIWFPSFSDNQPNLRKDRESPSNIPEYDKKYDYDYSGVTPELLRQNDGVTPEKCRHKLREVKLSKDNKNHCNSSESPSDKNTELPRNVEVVPQNVEVENWKYLESIFREKQKYDNWGKQRKHLKELDKRIIKIYKDRAPPESLSEFTKKVVGFFWYLKKNGDNFWKKQPFYPSTLNSEGMWTRYLEEIKKRKPKSDEELLEGIEYDT